MRHALSSDLFSQAAIAFDLDGTLVDTAPDLVRALNAVILPRGLDPVQTDDVRAMVGRGARALIERSYARQGRSLSETDAAEQVGAFIEVYKADIARDSRVFPHVHETLEAMKTAGAKLSVCTNKPSVLSDLLLDSLELTPFFERIIGPERTSAKKPAADHVWSALGQRGGYLGMVGDSAPDVDAAKAAGVPSIVMSYGYSEQPASSLGADRLLHEFGNVPHALADLWRGGA